jgi:hypothetical protein
MLLEAGLVTPEGLRAGLEAQRLSGGRLGCHLLRLGSVVPASLHLYLSEHLEALRPDLVRDLRDGAAAGLIPARLAHHYGLMPARVADGVLDLAVASADALPLRPAIEILTGLAVEPIICPPALIAEGLERFYPGELEPGILFRGVGDHQMVLSGAEPADRLTPGAPPSAYLRGILAEAVRRSAQRAEIVPRAEGTDIVLASREGRALAHTLPRGPYAGIASLLEGLARIAARGRILPRDGRFTLFVRGRRVVVSVLALPGLQGHTYRLDLREETIVPRPGSDRAASAPGLTECLERMAGERRGLLLLAGIDAPEHRSGLELALAVLGDRLPRCDVAASWPASDVPYASGAGGDADLIATRWPTGPVERAALLAAARERVVVAAIEAVDAADAARRLFRHRSESGSFPSPVGVLAVRLVEALCLSCRVRFDLAEVLAGIPQPRLRPEDVFWTSPGCADCRGSGVVRLESVEEFRLLDGGASRPGIGPRRARDEGAPRGQGSLFQSAVRAAAAARIDVKESLRLLHERR